MDVIKTLVFLDIESTGLPTFRPPKSVRCTEVCLVAIHRNHFDNRCTDFRVINKLNICVQPTYSVDQEAVNISGLDNNNLETQKTFSCSTAKLLAQFLALLEPPVCLLAHNGLKFDFPLLKAEFLKTQVPFPQDILCLDTYQALLHVLPELHNDTVEEVLEKGRIPREASETTPPHRPLEQLPDKCNYSPVSDHEKNVDTFIVDLTLSPENNSQNLQTVMKTNTKRDPSEIVIDLTESPMVPRYPTYSPKYISPGGEKSASNKSKVRRSLFSSKTEESDFQKLKKFKPNLSHQRSYKLKDLYQDLLGVPLTDAHEAEVDTIALMKVCHKVSGFTEWMDKNATAFWKVKSMW